MKKEKLPILKLTIIIINDKYRICFVWAEKGPDQVEIVDYH